MKAKLKNANGAVRFLLSHGEKVGIVLLLGLAGWLFYASLGRERLQESQLPDALQRNATQAEQHINNMSWESFPPEERIQPPKKSNQRVIGDVVKEDAFPMLPPIDPRVTPALALREDPVLLAVKEPVAVGGQGLWAVGDPEKLRKIRLEAIAEAKREQYEQEQERIRSERDAERGGRPGEGFGGPQGGMYGAGGGEFTKSGAAIIRPNTGAMAQGTGVEIIESRAWVSVTAVVPYKAQFEAYKSALENARGYSDADVPEYFAYQVQRAEVTPDGVGEWKLLGTYRDSTIVKELSTYPVQMPEVVNPKHVHPLLTHALPPMMLRQWGDEATHPTMPIPTPEELMQEQMGEMQDMTAPQPEEPLDSDDPLARPDPRELMRRQAAGGFGGEFGGGYGRPGGEFGGGMMGGRGEFGGGMGMRGGYGMMGMGGGGEFGGMMGMGGGFGAMADASTGALSLPPYVWDFKTKNLLFRFFDTTVQPGSRYKYRVRLVLTDANAYKPARYLSPEVNKRLNEEKEKSTAKTKKPKGYRFTDWSEPSSTAVVPPPGLIYIAGGEPANPSNPNSEPEADVIVKSLDADYAAEVAVEDSFTRGSVINLQEFAKVIWSSTYSTEEVTNEPKFDFRTGMTLLDMRGGGRLGSSRDLDAPVRALVMDSGGRLVIQDELDDEKVAYEYKFITEAADKMRRDAADRGGGGGAEFGGGRRGR